MVPGRIQGVSFGPWASTKRGQRTMRYLTVSVLSVVVGQVALACAFALFGWTARWSNLFGFVLAAIPSYYLNRAWAWGKTGRSNLAREVLPFWVIAFVGLVFSTAAVGFVADHTTSMSPVHSLERTGLILAAALAAGAVTWVAKFVVFDKYLFGSTD